MRYLEFRPVAEKHLAKLPVKDQQNLVTAIERLVEIPPQGDIKLLRSRNGQYRLRVRTYRVLFYIRGDIILIHDVGNRGQIYK
jgi:mRNA interferase RelE/StbE